MENTAGRIGYQEVWQRQLGALSMMQATSKRKAVALLTNLGIIVLLDDKGEEIWRFSGIEGIRTISLADTLEILAVDETGSTYLIDAHGKLQWKKRPVPALYGVISADGQSIALVTREPAVVMLDRIGRIRWTYRNLFKIPAALDISADGRTVAFACLSDCGEGLQAIGPEGKPYDSFMGIDPLQDLCVSADGQIVVALDRANDIFCLNCVKSRGIWRGRLNKSFNGVSWSDITKRTLLYSKSGLLSLLNEQGEPIWEYRFPVPLLRAELTSDAENIWYATPDGRVGCMSSISAHEMSALEFVEVNGAADETSKADLPVFSKLWMVELSGKSTISKPLALLWSGTDKSEYTLLWDGRDTLYSLNDFGDEIWRARLPATAISALCASAEADIAFAVGRGGAIAFKCDGTETSRLFGAFKTAHIFASGTALLLTASGEVRYSRETGRFTQNIALRGPVNTIYGDKTHAWLIGEHFIATVNADGTKVGEFKLPSAVSFIGHDNSHAHIILGTLDNLILTVNERAELTRKLVTEEKADNAIFHDESGAIFIVHAGIGVTILQTKAGTKVRIPVRTGIKASCLHRQGAVIATGIDELILIEPSGHIAARSSFPDRILSLLPHLSDDSVYVCAENGFGLYAPKTNKPTDTPSINFLEM